MMKRMEIEQAENGFQVTVWKEEEESDSSEEMLYPEPKRYVAGDVDEVVAMVQEKLTMKKDKK